MAAKATGLGDHGQPPKLQFDAVKQRWLVWLAYNRDMSAGTWLELWENGRILRHTEQPTGEISTIEVKPPE